MSNETTSTFELIEEIFESREKKYDFPWNIVHFYEEKSNLKGDYLSKLIPKIKVSSYLLDLHIKNYQDQMSEYQLQSLKNLQKDLKECHDLCEKYWDDLEQVQMPQCK